MIQENIETPVNATVSVSLNFNNDTQYQFTVAIPKELERSGACKLIGVNYAGQRFVLDGLGKALMRLLVQLDIATNRAEMTRTTRWSSGRSTRHEAKRSDT